MNKLNDNTITILVVCFWTIFFVVQVAVGSELVLTIVALIGALTAGAILPSFREKALLVVGIALGCGIEVGLGLVLRQQHWEQATLLGVPMWLPLIWGLGFIAIRRIGNAIVGL
jgi:hypothetical protein